MLINSFRIHRFGNTIYSNRLVSIKLIEAGLNALKRAAIFQLNSFLAERTEEGRNLPKFILREFESYLRCGIYAHGFGRVQCGSCQHEKIVPYSCKGRGFCPSCGARRMSEAAIHLVDELLPIVPVRQFVVTFPVQLRLWMARSKSLCAKVCEKVCAELTAHLQRAAGIEESLGQIRPIAH